MLPTLVGQQLLLFVMTSKLNFWLLKVFIKSPSEFSDNIFHYLIKAKITAKNALNVRRSGMLMVSASMLQGQGAATSYETASPLEGKICLDTFPLLLNQFKEILTMNQSSSPLSPSGNRIYVSVETGGDCSLLMAGPKEGLSNTTQTFQEATSAN